MTRDARGSAPLRFLVAVAAMVLLASVTMTGVAAADGPADVSLEELPGEGTSEDPYELSNASELQAMSEDLTAHYVLADDIDASETAAWNDGSGFEPIEAFDGTFDGNGHTIANLYQDGGIDVGLFDTIRDDGTVENVTVEDVDATGDIYVGGIAATNEGTIANVSVTGTLEATNVGGVATENDGQITDARTAVEIRDASFRAGGLAATNAGTITDSIATGTSNPASNVSDVGGAIGYNRGERVANVSTDVAIEMEHADGRAGGLIGTNYEGEVTRSSASGDVRASGIAGGLIGSTNDNVSDSYAMGDVTGDIRVGGLVGSTVGEATVSRSYALGDVTGNDTVGGLVGDNSGLVTESYAAGAVDADGVDGGVVADETDSLVFGETNDVYWDATVSGIDDSVNGTALSTAELTGEDAANALEGFDFENTWKTTDSYPIHGWDAQSDDEDRREPNWTAESTVQVDLEPTAANPNDTVAATVNLRNPPAEAAAYEVTLEVADDAVANIDRLEAADGFAVTETETDVSSDRATVVLERDDALAPADSGTVATADLLATAAGTTDVTAAVDVTAGGTTATVDNDTTTIEVEAVSIGPVAGTVPQDTTGDGLRNDFDGDGRTTHDDVTIFFEHLEDDAVQNNPEAFDFDGNEQIGFGDVITLLQEI